MTCQQLLWNSFFSHSYPWQSKTEPVSNISSVLFLCHFLWSEFIYADFLLESQSSALQRDSRPQILVSHFCSSSGSQKRTWFWRSMLSLPYTALAVIRVLQAKLCPWGSRRSPVAFCRLHSCQATTYSTLLKIHKEKENSMILTYFSSWSQRIWL